jgi:CRISPR-associated protein Cas1
LLRGDYRSLWPWLCLCEQIGLGKELGFGFGQFRIDAPAPPILTARWTNLDSIAHVADDIVERYDSAQAELAAETAIPFDAAAVAREIADELVTRRYTPAPHQAFLIGKKDGGTRRVEFPAFRDLVVAQHLKKLLEEPLDALFEPSSLGYRKGRSKKDVIARIEGALADGFKFVLESDVDDFFPSVEHGRLETLLTDALPASDRPLVDCVMRLVRAGYVLDANVHQRERGLVQGNPLSPLLANLYLDAFDEAIAERNVRLVRYADDFVILTRTRDEAEELLKHAEATLRSIGLQLKEAKTRVAPVTDGFTFLGMRFPRNGHDELPFPVHDKKPLYVTEPGLFVAINGDAVALRKSGAFHESIPLRLISDIFIMGYGAVSNALLKRCATFGIPITFCLSDGYHINTVAPDSRRFFEVSHRQALRYYQLTDAERLEIARMLVRAKIANSQALFRQRHNERTSAAVAKLDTLASQVDDITDLTTLRGLEGLAARTAFAHWAGLIDVPGFEFTKRARENPDRINSLLNFGYHLLFTRLNALVRGLGLNPYLGFLHESGDRYETLVCDLQEPFRANVDRMILTLINQRSVKPEDFEDTRRGLRLTGAASRSFVLAFERMLARVPRGRSGMPLAAALYSQALSMNRYLCEGETLQVYRWEPAAEDA